MRYVSWLVLRRLPDQKAAIWSQVWAFSIVAAVPTRPPMGAIVMKGTGTVEGAMQKRRHSSSGPFKLSFDRRIAEPLKFDPPHGRYTVRDLDDDGVNERRQAAAYAPHVDDYTKSTMLAINGNLDGTTQHAARHGGSTDRGANDLCRCPLRPVPLATKRQYQVQTPREIPIRVRPLHNGRGPEVAGFRRTLRRGRFGSTNSPGAPLDRFGVARSPLIGARECGAACHQRCEWLTLGCQSSASTD